MLRSRADIFVPIIFVPYIQGFGGVERLILSLTEFLHAQGCTPCIVSLRDSIGLRSYTAVPVNMQVLNAPRHALAEAFVLRRRLTLEPRSTGTRLLVFD